MQKLSTIVSETEAVINDVRDMEDELADGLAGMKENLADATMDMSSASALVPLLSLHSGRSSLLQ